MLIVLFDTFGVCIPLGKNMGAVFNTVKWFVFALNFMCLIIGVGVLCVNILGLESSLPGTDAHTFFILGLLICFLLCLTTVVGCYGITSEVFGVNIFYSIFLIALLVIQYLQIRSFQSHGIYFNTLQGLESAWRVVDTEPQAMDELQTRYWCCGLFNERDYTFKHLTIPKSCYSQGNVNYLIHPRGCWDSLWKSYIYVSHRQELFNWALLLVELITLFYSLILNILIFRRRFRNSRDNDDRVVGARELFIPHNHVGSRQHLVSN